MVSEAQKRADQKHKKEKTNLFPVRFYQTETDLWEYLQSQPNKAGFVKGLIRDHMEKNS